MDFFFVGCLQNCVINILSTVTKFSTCDSLLYSDDTAFSISAVLAPLLAKLVDSSTTFSIFNRLNAELNPFCHLLALLEAHHILHVSRVRVNLMTSPMTSMEGVG